MNSVFKLFMFKLISKINKVKLETNLMKIMFKN